MPKMAIISFRIHSLRDPGLVLCKVVTVKTIRYLKSIGKTNPKGTILFSTNNFIFRR